MRRCADARGPGNDAMIGIAEAMFVGGRGERAQGGAGDVIVVVIALARQIITPIRIPVFPRR